MKVIELIDELKKYDMDSNVYVGDVVNMKWGDIYSVEGDDDSVCIFTDGIKNRISNFN